MPRRAGRHGSGGGENGIARGAAESCCGDEAVEHAGLATQDDRDTGIAESRRVCLGFVAERVQPGSHDHRRWQPCDIVGQEGRDAGVVHRPGPRGHVGLQDPVQFLLPQEEPPSRTPCAMVHRCWRVSPDRRAVGRPAPARMGRRVAGPTRGGSPLRPASRPHCPPPRRLGLRRRRAVPPLSAPTETRSQRPPPPPGRRVPGRAGSPRKAHARGRDGTAGDRCGRRSRGPLPRRMRG